MTAPAMPNLPPLPAGHHATVLPMFTQPTRPDTTVADNLRRQLAKVVKDGAANHPRSLQTRMGPSELGEPCALRMAYKLLDWPASNAQSDPLPSIVGTGAHAMFAGYFENNTETVNGQPRYVVEQKVEPRADIPGSCDLFDRATGTVIDWKFQGTTSLSKLKREGLTGRYRVQLHTYGLGWANQGETVRHVALVSVPRGGFLTGMHIITEPYNPQIALDALERKDNILALVDTLDVETNPQNWGLLPRDTTSGCRFCDWFLPGSTDLARGCPGDTAT